ncbi:MAG: hypothetical protein K8R76_05245 [Candidatus Aegiribacteria sp.]|nr:hypothetical protein [Candidatus Aegiribacteria sp.]
MSDPVFAEAFTVTGFTVKIAPPDTLPLHWFGEGSAVISDILVSARQEVAEGDTLLFLLEGLRVVEQERLSMELDVALALSHSTPMDTMFLNRVDSLSLLLDSISSFENSVFLSVLDGILININITEGQNIRPGDVLAEISVESSSVFLVYPPDNCTIDRWPLSAGEMSFVEQNDCLAVYSGVLSGSDDEFSMYAAVPRETVFENDLDSYLITADNDTISVLRSGIMTNGLIIIQVSKPVCSELVTWAER